MLLELIAEEWKTVLWNCSDVSPFCTCVQGGQSDCRNRSHYEGHVLTATNCGQSDCWIFDHVMQSLF